MTDRKLRLAVLGAGGLGRSMVRLAEQKPGIVLVSICDSTGVAIDPEGLVSEDVLAAAEGGAVADTPRAGRRVRDPLGEMIAARDIIDTCAAHRVKLCINHQRRYASTERKAKELIRDGLLGRIFRIKVRHAVDCAKWLNAQAGWRTDAAVSGGGIWLLWGVHYADLLRFLTGEEAESVYARVRNVACPDIETEDDAFGLVQMSGGVLGEVEVSAAWKSAAPAGSGPAGEMVEIYGTEGSLTYSRTEGVMRLASSRLAAPGAETLNVAGGAADWADAQRMLHEAFLTSITRDAPVPVTGDDGQRALEIILAGYTSSRQDRPVPLPLTR